LTTSGVRRGFPPPGGSKQVRQAMSQYLPWLIGGVIIAIAIAALLYLRMSQVESD
jgi:hypothetical protein